MNRRYVLVVGALLIALLVIGVGMTGAQPSPDSEGQLGAMEISLGQPGLSFRYVDTLGVTEMAWLADSDHLNGPDGLGAVGPQGKVYVTDSDNHRIRVFAPGVPGWLQVNLNGFGEVANWAIQRMAILGDHLYAGTENDEAGGQVWRTPNGTDWSQVNVDGFGNVFNTGVILGEEPLNGYLYAGTANETAGGEIWRCAICDGSDWSQVVSGGFGDSNNVKVDRTVVFADSLYAAANNYATGAEVWRSSTGDPGSWTQSNVDGFGDDRNTGLWEVIVHGDHLYAATTQWGAWIEGTQTGVEVWRTGDGIAWTQVNTDGFGEPDNFGGKAVTTFGGFLYVSAYNYDTGTQVWRCVTCDGTDWGRVVGDGFGNSNNTATFMIGFGDHLYAGTDNGATGTEVWRSPDGLSWSLVTAGGFGDSNNGSLGVGTVYDGKLFLGTKNRANGGEIWMMLHQKMYLPAILRSDQ